MTGPGLPQAGAAPGQRLQGGPQPGVQCRRGVHRLRPGAEAFGTEDLEGVVKSNILMVEMAMSSRPGKK